MTPLPADPSAMRNSSRRERDGERARDPQQRAAAFGMLQMFRGNPAGYGSEDRWAQVNALKGVIYVAVKKVSNMLGGATFSVVCRKRPDRKRTTFGPNGVVSKALPTAHAHARDEAYTPFDDFDHPLAKLIERPNNHETFGLLVRKMVDQNLLTGISPLWTVPSAAGKPVELWSLKTATTTPLYQQSLMYPEGAWRVQPQFSQGGWVGGLLGGRVGSAGAVLPGNEVARFVDPHPFIEGDGYSRLTACGVQLDVLQSIDQSRHASMQYGVNMSAVLTVPGMDQGLTDRLESKVNESHAGPHNSGKVFVFSPPANQGPADKPTLMPFTGNSAKEMDYAAGWEQMVKFCLAVFGVPPTVAGLAGTSSYSELYAGLEQFRHEQSEYVRQWQDFFTQTLAWPYSRFHGEFKVQIDLPAIADKDLQERQLAADVGIRSVNERRAARNLDPVKHGEFPEQIYAKLVEQDAMPKPEAPPPGDPSAAGAPPADPSAGQPAAAPAVDAQAGDPLAALLGGADAGAPQADDAQTEGQGDGGDETQNAVLMAALKALGLDDEDGAPVQKAVAPTKPGATPKHAEGQKFESNGKWFVISQGRAVPTANPGAGQAGKPVAAPAGGQPAAPTASAPAVDYDAVAKQFLGGRPFMRRNTPTGSHDIKDGASLKAYIDAGGKFEGDDAIRVAGTALAAPAAAPGGTPSAPTPSKPAAAPAQPSVSAPTAVHEGMARRLLRGRPSLKLPLPGGNVHEVKDGASLKTFLDAGGKLPQEMFAEPAQAVPASTPAAKATLSKVDQWASAQAEKHADRVAAHFGVSREKAKAILTDAIRHVANHAKNNGGKASGTLKGPGGKTLRLTASKPGEAKPALPRGKPVAAPARATPAAADWQAATAAGTKPDPKVPARGPVGRALDHATKYLGTPAEKRLARQRIAKRTAPTAGAVPRPVNAAAKGTGIPRARIRKAVEVGEGGLAFGGEWDDAEPVFKSAEHAEGQKFEGTGGHWFVIRDGHAVPTAAPGAAEQPANATAADAKPTGQQLSFRKGAEKILRAALAGERVRKDSVADMNRNLHHLTAEQQAAWHAAAEAIAAAVAKPKAPKPAALPVPESAKAVHALILGGAQGLRPDQVEHHTEQVGNVLARMPAAAHARLDANLKAACVAPPRDMGEQYIADNAEFWKAKSAAVYEHMANKYRGPGVAACYNAQLRKVYMPSVVEAEDLRGFKDAKGLGYKQRIDGLYAHELMHAIDGPGWPITESPAWQAAFRDEIHVKPGERAKLTQYAASEPAEGLAEFGRLLYGSDVPLADVEATFPKCAAVFKEHDLWPKS